MDQIELRAAVDRAMQDGRISEDEQATIVGRALASGGISVDELVAARGLLASSRKSVGRAAESVAAAEARFDAAEGVDKVAATVELAEARGRSRFAQDRAAGLERIERSFSQQANILVRGAASVVDIGRAIGDVFE